MKSARSTPREAAGVQRVRAATAGLVIRPLLQAHAAPWISAIERSRSAIQLWEEWPDAVSTLDAAVALLERLQADWHAGRTFSFGIFTDEGSVIGGVTVSNVLWDCRCADLGYWVEPGHGGKGIAAWAASHLVDFCFRVLRLQRLALVIRVDHLASQRVAQKLGAQFEGVARKRIFHAQRALDAKVYAITQEDDLPMAPSSLACTGS